LACSDLTLALKREHGSHTLRIAAAEEAKGLAESS
jgi:hypothetical protein